MDPQRAHHLDYGNDENDKNSSTVDIIDHPSMNKDRKSEEKNLYVANLTRDS
jgi:hypothetical protein